MKVLTPLPLFLALKHNFPRSKQLDLKRSDELPCVFAEERFCLLCS